MASGYNYSRPGSVDVCSCFSFLYWARPSQTVPNGYAQQRTGSSWHHSRRNANNSPRSPPRRQRILFYHKHNPYYGFTNFSAHPVKYRGKRYPTSEHLFQALKFFEHRPLLAEHIRTCSKWPSDAFSEAHRFQSEVRSDWQSVKVQMMEEVLRLKFEQHSRLKRELLATGDAELVEDSDKDSFWGVGADRKGRNELGKALMRLRDKFRGYHR